MEVIFFLIGCSVLVAALFLVAFLWSVKTGQYNDTETPAMRMLIDDDTLQKPNTNNTESL